MEEEQTTQWSKEQKDKQRSTMHTHRYKDRVTRTPLKPGVNSNALEELAFLLHLWHKCVNIVTNPVISHALGTEREVFTTSGTYSSSFVTQISHSGQSCHCGDRKTFDVMTSNNA